jgi:hypothetical protein
MRVSVPLPQFLAQQVLRLLRACRRANQSLPHQKSTNEFSVFFGQAPCAHQRPWISSIQGRRLYQQLASAFRNALVYHYHSAPIGPPLTVLAPHPRPSPASGTFVPCHSFVTNECSS